MQVDRFWYANQTETVSDAWHYASGVFSFLCLFFGIISNGLVILVFIRNNVLQRPRNYYLINLAVTDIGLLLTNSSMHVISSFKKRWIFGQIGCNFYSVCGGVFGLTSIATMAAISLTRFAAVNDPFSSLKLSGRFTLACLACAWIYGSLWIMPPLFGWNRFILEGFGTSCTFDYISKDIWDRTFILVLITGGFLIPLAIILLSYSLILIKLSERGRQFRIPVNDEIDTNQQGTAPYFSQLIPPNEHRPRSGTQTTLDYNVDENNIIRNARRTEARATRTALLICALFCLAWGPYALMALISFCGFNHLVNAYTTNVLGLFTKVAACINPLIYALSLNGFQEQICAYIKWCTHCSDEEHRHRLISINQDSHRKTHGNLPDTTTTRQSDPLQRLNI